MNHYGITPESLLNHPFREPQKGHAREALRTLPPTFTAPKPCIPLTVSRSQWAHSCATPPSFLHHPFRVPTAARRRKAFEGSLFLPKGTSGGPTPTWRQLLRVHGNRLLRQCWEPEWLRSSEPLPGALSNGVTRTPPRVTPAEGTRQPPPKYLQRLGRQRPPLGSRPPVLPLGPWRR